MPARARACKGESVLEKLTGLERRWVLYDVGNSAFVMLTSTVIPIYFKNVAGAAGVSMADSTAYWSYAASLCTLIVALLGPVLGAMADARGLRKPFFVGCLLLGAGGCLLLSAPMGYLAFLGVYVLAKIGLTGSFVFYDSMLGDVTEDARMDVVSSKGYAWGYLGSCIPFTACLLLILTADKTGLGAAGATAVGFWVTGLWWIAMALPLIRQYRQRHGVPREGQLVRKSLRRIAQSVREFREQPHILLFLLAFFFYIDGVYTIIDLATSYGKDVGIGDTHLLLALLLTQVVAFPCSLWFAKCSKRLSTHRLVEVCIFGYICITLFALQLDQAWEFWFLAVCVAVFQGAIQALSRSYFARIIPKEKASEYFGFYDIFGKGAAFTGTLLVGISTQLSGTSKMGVALIPLLFAVGWWLLRRAVALAQQRQAGEQAPPSQG